MRVLSVPLLAEVRCPLRRLPAFSRTCSARRSRSRISRASRSARSRSPSARAYDHARVFLLAHGRSRRVLRSCSFLASSRIKPWAGLIVGIERARVQHRNRCGDGAIAESRRSSGAAGHLGSRQCACRRRDAISRWLQAHSLSDHPCTPRMHRDESRADVRSAWRDGHRLAPAVRLWRAMAITAVSVSRALERRTATIPRQHHLRRPTGHGQACWA